MLEAPHVLYILGLLKDTYAQPSDEPPPRLPSYTTLIISHALRGVFYPSNFIYPLTSRFLLQRPELDIKDVPMLYGMLYSSSGDWKKERGWIIRMLADGAMSSDDWQVLKRRHTWDLLASLFQTSDTDYTLQKSILEVCFLPQFSRIERRVLLLGPRQSYLHCAGYQVLDLEIFFVDLDSDANTCSFLQGGCGVGQDPGEYSLSQRCGKIRGCYQWRMAQDRKPLPFHFGRSEPVP